MSLVLAAGVAECASVKVKTNHDATADFSRYTTFSIAPSNSIESEDVRAVVEEMIAADLTSKGLHEVGENPDLVVTYDAALGSHQQIYAGIGYAVETVDGATTVYVVSEAMPMGAIAITLIERSSGTIVWQGVGKGALKSDVPPERRIKRLEAAIKKILASYPPKV